jgi:O-antigen/teichoic acid export membrane protein
MSGYLRRLASTGAAYTAASVISKLIAVALLPLYTRFLSPADYGAAEVMFAAVVAISIVIRLGVIEALLRFYYKTDEQPERVVSTSFASLFWAGTVSALVLMPFAGPISELLLGTADAELARVAIAGLWVLTLSEYLLTLFRLDERALAFFVVTMLSVALTIPVTIVLVVALDLGAVGLLLGSYGTGAVIVLGLIAYHHSRLSLPSCRCTRSASSTASSSPVRWGWPKPGSTRLRSRSRRRSTCSSVVSSWPSRRWPTR